MSTANIKKRLNEECENLSFITFKIFCKIMCWNDNESFHRSRFPLNNINNNLLNWVTRKRNFFNFTEFPIHSHAMISYVHPFPMLYYRPAFSIHFTCSSKSKTYRFWTAWDKMFCMGIITVSHHYDIQPKIGKLEYCVIDSNKQRRPLDISNVRHRKRQGTLWYPEIFNKILPPV